MRSSADVMLILITDVIVLTSDTAAPDIQAYGFQKLQHNDVRLSRQIKTFNIFLHSLSCSLYISVGPNGLKQIIVMILITIESWPHTDMALSEI